MSTGFNPSVGILFCRTRIKVFYAHDWDSFNPSVGILFCRTSPIRNEARRSDGFQSLGRDSVLSNSFPSVELPSINHAFQSLGRDSVLSNATW